MRFPISIELHRSGTLFVLLLLFHLLATGCVLVVPWPWAIRLIVLVFVGLSASHSMRSPKIVGPRLPTLDRLDCLMSDGNQHEGTILPDSTVFSRLIVLRLKVGEERRVSSLTLLPDQMSVDEFRVLGHWLRWPSETKQRAEKVL